MRIALVAALLTIARLAHAQAPAKPLPFTDPAWQLQGEKTTIARDDGREVLQIETGFGFRRDVALRDGTIDFDVRLTSRRSFVYLYFRAEGDGEREEFYLRPHKTGLPDALQYAPVWQGKSAWQLHHGPGGTAAVTFEPGAWTHVRAIVQGERAALFVNDMSAPALVVPKLSRAPRPGFIAVGGFLPADVPGKGPIATFANVTLRPDVVEFDLAGAVTKADTPAPAAAEETIVREWALSHSFVPKDAAVPALPDHAALGSFTRLPTEPTGLLELHRHVTIPKGSNVTAAVARITIDAPRAGTYTFDLGFSDIATVFLNGRPIFRGDGTYAFDRPRREGLIGFDQARLFLPLSAGENDLAVVVSDSFGGWGVMGRFVGGQGLKVGVPASAR